MRALAAAIAILAGLWAAPAAVGQGGEFRVNEGLEGIQRAPAIAASGDGRFVVAWTRVDTGENAEDVYVRRFAPDGSALGPETRTHTDTNRGQFRPAVAAAPDGRFVAVWTSHVEKGMLDVHARLYGADGEPAGEVFTVNTTADSSQANPDVAIDDEGNFCIVWHSWFQDGGDRGIYGRCYLADGSPRSEEFLVNETTAFSQANPAIAMAGDGRFVVAWEAWKDDGEGAAHYDAYVRAYDADGSAVGGERMVNQVAADDQWHVDVDMRDDASFVVVWTSWEQDGDDGAVMVREYDAAANPVADEIRVNTTTAGYQWLPAVAVIPGGTSFVVAWSGWRQDGDREGVVVRWLDSAGRVAAPELNVNFFGSGFQWEPAFAVVSGAEVAVVWSSWGQASPSYDLFGRVIWMVPASIDRDARAAGISLLQNHPNPFRYETAIAYKTERPADVRLEVFDVLGRAVRVLQHGFQPAGAHRARWDGRDEAGRIVSSGVYLYRLQIGGHVAVRRLVRL